MSSVIVSVLAKREAMSERKYTVAEIDRMRDAIEHQWLFGRKISTPEPNPREVVDENGIISSYSGISPSPYNETEKTKCVEEMLRTYMLAGIEPEDLE